MFILDTDVLTLLWNGHTRVVTNALSVPAGDLATTIVTVEEVFIGWYSQIRRARTSQQLVSAYDQLNRAVSLFRTVRIVSMNQDAADLYSSMRSTYRRAGAGDLKIAAIALESSATLVTRNLVDFQAISGLILVDWAA